MPAYCDVDGVPVPRLARAADDDPARRVGLRRHRRLRLHRRSRCSSTAAPPDRRPRRRRRRLALRAGVDSELPRTAAYGAPLAAAIEDGRVDERLVDLAVGADPAPEVPARAVRAPVRRRRRRRRRSTRSTPRSARSPASSPRRSIVLVENDGIAAAGPADRRGSRSSARSPTAPATSWATTPPGPHRDARASCAHAGEPVRLRRRATWSSSPATSCPARPTILDALRERFGGERVVHARGSGISRRHGRGASPRPSRVARDADVAIVVVGERSGLTDDATTGEFRDRRDLGLLGRQQELLEAVVATGTPTVLVVVSGRPLALEWAAEHCAAILLAWVPGEAGPAAIADVLAGDVDPGGRLPVTMPAPRRPGPADLPPPPDRRPVELEGRLRRRPVVAALAVRATGSRTRPSRSATCASTRDRCQTSGDW